MDYEYLSDEQLAGFDKYKYSSMDTSPISVYIMHPFWNRLVEYMPRWVAPNLMTFAGFLLTVLNFVIVAYFDYNFVASAIPPANPPMPPLPRWLWLLIGISLFVAYTLDGIDGKQARRTKSSGPLGELFDHGLDSYAASLVPICLYSCFGQLDHTIPVFRMYLVLWNILISFYLSHWEKYNTGVLFLPWGYDFGMISSAFVFMATGIFGHQIWKTEFPFGLNSGSLFEILIHVTSFGCNIPVSMWNVHKSYRDKTGKDHSIWEAIRPLWALLSIMVLTTTWIILSPNDMLNYDPRVVYTIVATLFSNVTTRLIVAQMSNTRCEVVNKLVLPFALAIFIALKIPRMELFVLYSICLFVLAMHLHYGTCLVRQMCRHFKVDCFKIKNQA
ncbi:ethanolaminephosphotransferase 1-like [Arctopsyche grandis]|uniref:ethanolaminephosphotransferase 1-like n=1 Tax=Arctopsyche grandis TaxID=121162 RepID=UPI00406D6DB3